MNRTDSDGPRRALSPLARVVVLAASALAAACDATEVQTLKPAVTASGGEIGDPCQSRDETRPTFAGHKVTEDTILTPFPGCASGLCLINHFQGRVSCPLGQAAKTPCAGPDDASCPAGSACVPTGPIGPFCDPSEPDGGASQCASGVCDAQRSVCECSSDEHCPQGATCDLDAQECTRFVCHEPGDCQSATRTDAENEGKSCCAEGGVPVTSAVCGQCEEGSGRSAADAAICTCRCGPDDDSAPTDAEFCECPSGFECALIRKDVGLGDQHLTGKYCIRQGTAYTDPDQCGSVSGHFSSSCAGTPSD